MKSDILVVALMAASSVWWPACTGRESEPPHSGSRGSGGSDAGMAGGGSTSVDGSSASDTGAVGAGGSSGRAGSAGAAGASGADGGGSKIGATTPFTSYEAEAGRLGGGAMIVRLSAMPTTEFSSPELESSGHAYVRLDGAGQYVEWTNVTGRELTAINVRASLPDAPGGGGVAATLDLFVDGQFRQALNLSSTLTPSSSHWIAISRIM